MTTTGCDAPDHLACVDVTTTVHLTEQFLRDVFVNAIEGGVNYWATITDYAWSDPDPRAVSATLTVREYPDEYPETVVTLDTVIAGIKHVLANPQLRPGMVTDIIALDAGDLDADDSDVIVQLGLFGQVRFG